MQAYPPWNSRGYPRDRRFLLKRLRVIRFPFHVDASLQEMPSEDFPPLSADAPQKMGGSRFWG